MNKFFFVNLLVCLVLITGLQCEEKFVFGWIGPLSGPASALGIDNLNSVKLAINEYNAKRSKDKNQPVIELVVADDGYDSVKTAEEYKKMIATAPKPTAIFLTTYSAVKELADSAAKDSVIIVDPIDNDLNLASLNNNIFLIAKETEEFAAIYANALIDMKLKNPVVAIYYNEDEFMKTLATTIAQILNTVGLPLKLFPYNKSRKDFGEFLDWGKANNSEAYLFLGYTEIAPVIKHARDSGITAPFFVTSVVSNKDFLEKVQGAAEGAKFAHFTSFNGNKIRSKEFLEKYEKIYRNKPFVEWTAMQAYDATNILIDALNMSLGQKGDRIVNLKNAMLKTSGFEGVSGRISINQNGSSKGIYPGLYILKESTAQPTNQ